MSEMDVRGEDSRVDELTDASEEEEVSGETPEADAVEQHQAVTEQRRQWRQTLPFDADPADAADQDRVVELDEDDYR